MFDKKKLNFWRLAVVFLGITLITLFFLWNSPKQKKAEMMNVSMGSMAKSMHLSNITIYNLLQSEKMEQNMMSTENHHQNQPFSLLNMSFITTGAIFLLLPFIIGGSIILAIVWLK